MKAVTATTHKLAKIIYNMLRYGLDWTLAIFYKWTNKASLRALAKQFQEGI